MAMRSTGNATIAFGMVSIPIKVYTATDDSKKISFNLLHEKCKGRLKQQYICETDDCVVSHDQMVKGYEFAKGMYVDFTAAEVKDMDEAASHCIEISEFVAVEKVDPIYYDKAYFLASDEGGAKAFTLFTEALKQSGMAGLARYAVRGKQYLVMLRTVEGGLIMQQMLYANQVRNIKDVSSDRVDTKPAEMKMALQLIKSLTVEKFDPTQYKDEVQARIQAAIDEKVKGGKISMVVQNSRSPMIIDLAAALKASLDATKK